MRESLIVLDTHSGEAQEGARFPLGDLKGKNEAWLRDILFKYPQIIPINDIDSTFGPLVPLCVEMQTSRGRIDAVYVNEHGRLTIVECKLWQNPQSRREVVSQSLDYVDALSKWTYSDLQRQVSMALKRPGVSPYELFKEKSGHTIDEREFVDSVSRSFREGRFLMLIAGDGIREGLQSLAELVNQRATKAFSVGIVEVALYDLEKDRVALQARALAKTEIIKRQYTIFNVRGDVGDAFVAEDAAETDQKDGATGGKLRFRAWWEPVLRMKFDDPEQEPPYWVGTNNAVLNTPFPRIYIKAWAEQSIRGKKKTGIFLSATPSDRIDLIRNHIREEKPELASQLPPGTDIDLSDDKWSPILLMRDDIVDDDKRREFLIENLNAFVNALRPRLKRWYEASGENA
jgi:hypothetical protein